MASELNQWTWQKFVQFLLDLHEDVLNKVTKYWDSNDLLTLEQLDSKQYLGTLISDAFKRFKLINLNGLLPKAVNVLERCGEQLKIVECDYLPFEPSVQYEHPISIYAEILARKSPNIVEFIRKYSYEYDPNILKLIVGYISQLQGRCKLRTVQINYDYEHDPEVAEMENLILMSCDSIEDIHLAADDSKAIDNVRQYLEKHGDQVKQLEIFFIKSAIEVAVEFSSYLKSGCRLIVKEPSSDSYDSTTLKKHLSILQNRTDLDCYVHIFITNEQDALPFDIIKSIDWYNKKWDYQKLAASKGIEKFEGVCDKELFALLTNTENLPKLKCLTFGSCPSSKEFRAFAKARGHSITLNGSIKSEEHIEDLTTISNHLKHAPCFLIELAVNESQEKYEIPFELLKKLASNINDTLITIKDRELYDRYQQLHSMLNEQEQKTCYITFLGDYDYDYDYNYDSDSDSD